MPATLPRRLTAPTFRLPAPGAHAARRALAFGLLALGVAWGHREAAQAVATWLGRPSAQAPSTAPRPGWVLVPAPAVAAPPSPAVATLPLALPPVPQPHAAPAAAHRAPRRPAPARQPQAAATPATGAEGPQAGALALDDASAPAPPQAPQPALAPGAVTQAPARPTRPPPTATLRFQLQRGAQTGRGLWQWAHDGQRYQVHLQAELAGRPLLDQLSQGGFDAAGLAPLRMVEQQRGRAVRAVNFQRDKALISFSGSAQAWALASGAQDRVSWLPQMMALVGGRDAPWREGAELALPVAGPRGDLDLWQFQLVDAEALQGEAALHWQRQPQRPYDARIDLWLARQAPHWPLAWQWQVVPGGEAVRWERAGPGEAPIPP